MTSSDNSRAQLRKQLRLQRNALSAQTQQDAALALTTQLLSLPEWHSATTVAAYLTNDGEVNLMPVINEARSIGQRISLPVIHPFNRQHLLFLHYHQRTVLTKNRFNIDEPVLSCPDVIPLAQHQIILMPLVGFDDKGNRLGMGGGFYDRALAGCANDASRPLFIGTAHDCQQVAAIPSASWDIPLDIIVTPSQIIRPGKNSH